MFIVISYDVQEDKRRTRIHKALKSYGQWVQYSVFECELEKKDYLR
ncbi:MAG: CRISPR-associated endonuclease Cas2, partial [Blastocatellia bacterium]|nr:CRISPR-associated endonuclease Cas2 [Blastocatellia bacterium]